MEEFEQEESASNRFWMWMLPVSWVLSLGLAGVAHLRTMSGGDVSDHAFQSALLLSIFLACFGLLAMRLTILRALEDNQRVKAAVIGGLTLFLNCGLIFYGLTHVS